MTATMYRIYAKFNGQIETVDVSENDIQATIDALIEVGIEPVKMVEIVWSERMGRYTTFKG